MWAWGRGWNGGQGLLICRTDDAAVAFRDEQGGVRLVYEGSEILGRADVLGAVRTRKAWGASWTW
jgi:hypothetical protein